MKYYGVIAYSTTVETAPSVWTEEIRRVHYRGDVLRLHGKQVQAGVNDDLNVTNKLSVIGDPYAFENFQHIKYVEWLGAKWKVTSVDVEFPRLILSIGGVYNE